MGFDGVSGVFMSTRGVLGGSRKSHKSSNFNLNAYSKMSQGVKEAFQGSRGLAFVLKIAPRYHCIRRARFFG